MPPKKASLLKGKGKKSAVDANISPNSPDDYLQEADALEIRMQKWRAGDIEKSYRAYCNAIAIYSDGLNKFPRDIDLAYNKAVLQYEAATEARLLKYQTSKLQNTKLELLRVSLDSYRYALQIDQGKSDLLFNTATVISDIAEILGTKDLQSRKSAVNLFREATELFSACLTKQELDFDQIRSLQAEFEEESQQHSSKEPSKASLDADNVETAEILEIVTPFTLISTALAGLDAMKELIKLISHDTIGKNGSINSVVELQQLGNSILTSKFPLYVNLASQVPKEESIEPLIKVKSLSLSTNTVSIETNQPKTDPYLEAKQNIAIMNLEFQQAILDAEYRNNMISFEDYAQKLNDAFIEQLTIENERLMFIEARALEDFVSEILQSSVDSQNSQSLRLAWNAVNKADDLLKLALTSLRSKNPKTIQAMDTEDITEADLWLSRGDLSLYHWKIAKSVSLLDGIFSDSKETTEKALEKALSHYNMVQKLAAVDVDIHVEAQVKTNIITTGNPNVSGPDKTITKEIIQHVIDQGLLS